MHSSSMSILNRNVRLKLAEKGMTVKDLAERIGLYREALSRILNGKVDTTIGNAERISEALDTPLCELIKPQKIGKKKLEPKAV